MYKVILTILTPPQEFLLPAIDYRDGAFALAYCLSKCYPDSLVEVTHRGIREVVSA